MPLNFANLSYGARSYPVAPTETLPLPTEFNFDDAEGCARRIFAIMSNASGGHTIHDCKVTVIRSRRVANLTGNGVHVFYNNPDAPKMTAEEAINLERETIALGRVTTDQYGDGWKRARWSNPTPVI